MNKYSKCFALFFLVVAFTPGLTLTNTVAGQPVMLQVVLPTEKAFAMTYQEWTARWWQYVLGSPNDTNIYTDLTGQYCGLGQWGPVFFLAGYPTGIGERTCTIPADKGLLVPLFNFAGSVPDDGPTIQAVISMYAADADLVDVDTLSFEIDGTPVPNLASYRFKTPIFSLTGAVPNFSSDGGCEYTTPHCYEGFRAQAWADGYWVMLKPLSPGKHTIHFHAEVPEWSAVQDATYHLTVLKK
jgi:hypothetical protein